MPYVIGIANEKGGVGKTSTAVNLSSGLAREGINTVLIDLASVGNPEFLSNSLKQHEVEFPFTIHDSLNEYISRYKENFSFIGGSVFVKDFESYFPHTKYRESVWNNLIHNVPYDVVVLDSGTSTNWGRHLTLAISDLIIIPTILDKFSLNCMRSTIDEYAEIEMFRNPMIGGLHLLPTFYDHNYQGDVNKFLELKDEFGSKLLEPIPDDSNISDSINHELTIWDYAPDTIGIKGIAKDGEQFGGYSKVIELLMGIVKKL